MKVFNQINDVRDCADSVVTIGTFDGLHRGHQDIIKTLTTIAAAKGSRAAVITFEPHPRHILDKKNKLSLLMSLDKKEALLEELGVDVLLVIPFTKEFSRITAEAFMDDVIMKHFHPAEIVIGYDHHFGHKRQGSPKFLQDYAGKQLAM